MNNIIKKLNDAVKSGTVTFNQMNACLWIEDEYKLEMKRISNVNKLLKHNWKLVKTFLNEKITMLKPLTMGEPEENVELRALLLAYEKTLSIMKGLENIEVLNEN